MADSTTTTKHSIFTYPPTSRCTPISQSCYSLVNPTPIIIDYRILPVGHTMPIRSRILKVLPILQRVPESNLESASVDSFRDASTSHDHHEPTSTTTTPTVTDTTSDPLNDDDYDHPQQQEQQEQQQSLGETRPQPQPRNSLDQLSELPNSTVGLSSFTSNSMGNSITSTGSRPSHSSMLSISSMPSLSSIVEQDLMSIGTLSLADSATTASMGPPTPPPIQVKLTPPLEDPSFVDHQRLVRRVHVDITTMRTMAKSPSSRISPYSKGLSPSPPTSQEIDDWNALQGKTIDVLEGNVFKPMRRTNPSNRWQTGNSNVAPLTHTQKLLLPRRGDVQPRLISRQESDVSMS